MAHTLISIRSNTLKYISHNLLLTFSHSNILLAVGHSQSSSPSW
jgi:hypothetical protein